MSEQQMAWFSSPHINSKWHLTSRVADDGKGVQVYIARCGTMIGSSAADPVPMRDVPPSRNDICKKCQRRRAS